MKNLHTTEEYLTSLIGKKVRVTTSNHSYQGILASVAEYTIKVVGVETSEIEKKHLKNIIFVWDTK